MKSACGIKIDRSSSVDMSDQLADQLKGAIQDGRYKPGDVLPTMQQLADEAGVSFFTARRTIERLTREGYVCSRPRIGTVVLAKDVTAWRGHVLLIVGEENETSYFGNSLICGLRQRLMNEGYLFSRLAVKPDDDIGRLQLARTLSQTLDYAVVLYEQPEVTAALEKANVPYVEIFGRAESRKDAWRVHFADAEEKARFARHCKKRGVRTVVEVSLDDPGTPTAEAELARTGIAVRKMRLDVSRRPGMLEAIKRCAYRKFAAMSPSVFPDLLVFWEDFAAKGALTAFLSRGIRIPEDVGVVSLTNRGVGVVYPKALTRFECDPLRHGEQLAEFVLGQLNHKRIVKAPSFKRPYVIGETFPF